jgi:hypothetical protein
MNKDREIPIVTSLNQIEPGQEGVITLTNDGGVVDLFKQTVNSNGDLIVRSVKTGPDLARSLKLKQRGIEPPAPGSQTYVFVRRNN